MPGLAEVIKYALIQNKTLFSLLKKYSLEILSMDHRIIEEMIFLSVQTKQKLLQKMKRKWHPCNFELWPYFWSRH